MSQSKEYQAGMFSVLCVTERKSSGAMEFSSAQIFDINGECIDEVYVDHHDTERSEDLKDLLEALKTADDDDVYDVIEGWRAKRWNPAHCPLCKRIRQTPRHRLRF